MTESTADRARRLRPLVPNCVTDRALRLRIAEGWDDQRIVTQEMSATHEPAFSFAPRRRTRKAAARYIDHARLAF